MGLAHVGVIQWLEENRIPVAYIGGTSMGGLISGLYASGMNSAELKEFIRQIDWSTAFRPAAPFHELAFRRKEDRRSFPNSLEFGLKNGFSLPSGLSPGHEVGLMLSHFAAPYGDMKSFDDLPTPFRCVGMDLLQGEQIVFRKGSLIAALDGNPVNPPEVDRALTTITGYGAYQSASYTFARRSGEDGLAVSVQQKSYGPPFINTGIDIEGSDTNNSRFGFGGRLTFLNTGFENSEWRTDFTVGLNNSIGSEYYLRLNGGKWFLAPRAFYSQRHEDLYEQRQRVNEIKVRDAGFGGDAGYAAGRFAEFRMGYVYDYINGKVTTGAALKGLSGVGFHAIRVRYVHDGQDSNVIARHGLRSMSDARWNFSTGGISQYGVLENASSVSKSYGPRYVLVSNLAGGTVVGLASVFPPFQVGGPSSLTAFGRGQLRGDHYYSGSVLGLRAFSVRLVLALRP